MLHEKKKNDDDNAIQYNAILAPQCGTVCPIKEKEEEEEEEGELFYKSQQHEIVSL